MNLTKGSAEPEHCIHAIFALLKIFKIEHNDPLIWQVGYLDTEIQKILERRDNAMAAQMNRYAVYAQGGVRNAASN